MVYYGNQHQLEYDFVVAPGADPSRIRLAFAGTRELRTDAAGNLVLGLPDGELSFHKPLVYQETTAGRQVIAGKYSLNNHQEVGFELGDYNHNQPLVIDPILAYSTYIGGNEADASVDIAVDAAGNAYVTGQTYSDYFPRVNEYPSLLAGYYSVFVFKLNPAGNTLLYSTILAGSDGGLSVGTGIAIDNAGRVYVSASTGSSSYPTKNAYQQDQPGTDVVISKLDTNIAGLGSLLYSTYLGGNSDDSGVDLMDNEATGNSIAVDAAGLVYVTGTTTSSNFPMKNAFQGRQTRQDVFVSKLDPNLSGAASLLYSTYIGGVNEQFFDGDERGQAIAVDGAGNAYVTGYTTSLNFPLKNAYQNSNHIAQDVFVLKLNTNSSGGAALLYSTYLGGNSGDRAFGIAVDAQAYAYVTGYTASPDFPVKNAYQATNRGGEDVFIAKLDTNACGANSLLYSTYFGGSYVYEESEWGFDIAVDARGNAYVVGSTVSLDFPTKNSLQYHRSGWCDFTGSICRDVFVVKLNTTISGTAGLIYSTLLGGGSDDRAYGIAIDAAGNAYITGKTESSDFPANNSDPDTDHIASDSDLFVAKIADPASAPPPDVDGDGVPDALDVCPGTPAGVTVDASGCPAVCAPPPSGMTGWWPGDGDANDIRSGHNGTLQDGAMFGAGKVAQAFEFDGVNDYLSAPFAQTGPFTIDFWASSKTGCQAEFKGLLASIELGGPGNPTDNSFQIDFDGAGNYRFRAGGTMPLNLTIGPASLRFQHLAVTYDGSVIRTYLDGQLKSAGSWSGPLLSFATLRLGVNRNGTGFFNGLIDEVEIFNRSLSQVELQSIFNAGTAGKCKNRPPLAVCQNVTVAAGSNCAADAAIDNGSSDPDGDTITLAQAPAGPYPLGNTTVTLTVTDSKGAYSQCTASVTVIDSTPPQVTPPTDANYQCISQVTPGHPSQAMATDNCSTPTLTVAEVSNGGAGSVASPLVITRVFTASDGAGNRDSATQTITVIDDIPPNLTAPPNVVVVTGPDATSCGVMVSDAALGAATAFDNCGSVSITRSGVPAGNFFPVGVTAIAYTANDGHGNIATATQTVTVADTTLPVLTCPPSFSVVGNLADSCGATVNPGAATAVDNCAGVNIAGVRSDNQPLSASYPLGMTTITWTATDAAGNRASCLQTVTVINPAPTVTLTGPATGAVYPVNTANNFTGSFTDNAGGTHTATWTFDEFTSAGTVNETTGAITGSFTFTEAGVYKVTLTVADGCGATGTASSNDGLDLLVVIYDPNGGWVTGGGWINSPAGAYVPNPALTGKANFGFVSKYQHGNSVPTGNTEFQFKAGNLNFSSNSYEWLVISGARAQYKGAGMINGTGDYRFMLTAIDGQEPGGGGVDKFRIRIWDNVGGRLVYDNQMNAPDTADLTTVLGGGSIVIHK